MVKSVFEGGLANPEMRTMRLSENRNFRSAQGKPEKIPQAYI